MNCPYCRTELDAPDAGRQKVCEGCGTPHHEECFAENGGCTLFGCKFAPPDEPKIRLQAAEIPSASVYGAGPQPGNPTIAYQGFGDTMAPTALWMQQTAAAPAPALSSTPPPPLSTLAATTAAQSAVPATPLPSLPGVM